MARTIETFAPRTVAREASKVMGRPVTDKQVRGLARDILPAYSKAEHPAYQSHAYTAQERDALMKVYAQRAGKGRKASPRATASKSSPDRRTRAAARAAKAAPESSSDA